MDLCPAMLGPSSSQDQGFRFAANGRVGPGRGGRMFEVGGAETASGCVCVSGRGGGQCASQQQLLQPRFTGAVEQWSTRTKLFELIRLSFLAESAVLYG